MDVEYIGTFTAKKAKTAEFEANLRQLGTSLIRTSARSTLKKSNENSVPELNNKSQISNRETDSVPLVKKKTSRKRKLLAHDSKKTKKTKFHKEVNLQMITRSKTKSLSPESNEGSSSPTSMSDSSGELKINESNIEKLPFLGENICEEVLNGLTNWPKSALGWKPIGEAFKLLRISAKGVAENCLYYYGVRREVDNNIFRPLDCILMKDDTKSKIKNLPTVAKIVEFYKRPKDDKIDVTILRYYRPEQIKGGRKGDHGKYEVFASRHKEIISLDSILDKCYVLNVNHYSLHRKAMLKLQRILVHSETLYAPLKPEMHPGKHRHTPLDVPLEKLMYCQHLYNYCTKTITKIKKQDEESSRELRCIQNK